MVYSISIDEASDWGKKLAEFLMSLGAVAGDKPLTEAQLKFMRAIRQSKEIETGLKLGQKYRTLDDVLAEL